MDKSKIIAVALLVCVGGALLFTKMQDPPAESGDDHDHDQPQPTAIAKTAPADANNASNAAPTDANANAATAPADANPATATEAKPEADVTELKIVDERVGTGPVANTGDQLSMNYKGTLLNGKVFDQSYGRGPFDFQLGAGKVIKGWDQGIVGMKVGGKRKLVIPAGLAYGEQSPSPDIPANSTLAFEVELLSVNGKSS